MPAESAGKKNREPHQHEVRDLDAAARRWEAVAKKIPAISAGTKLQKKEKPAVRDLLTAGLEIVNTSDADAVSLLRKKLVATASCREDVYNRAGEPSATFCGKGGG